MLTICAHRFVVIKQLHSRILTESYRQKVKGRLRNSSPRITSLSFFLCILKYITSQSGPHEDNAQTPKGKIPMYVVIYDGNCNLCVTLVQLLEKLDAGQQFSYVPMQDAATLSRFGVTAADCEMGMILIAPAAGGSAEQRWQGSDAAEEIGRLLPMGSLFVQAYRAVPGMKFGGDRTYEFVRDNRYKLFGKRDQTYTSDYTATQATCADDTCEKYF